MRMEVGVRSHRASYDWYGLVGITLSCCTLYEQLYATPPKLNAPYIALGKPSVSIRVHPRFVFPKNTNAD